MDPPDFLIQIVGEANAPVSAPGIRLALAFVIVLVVYIFGRLTIWMGGRLVRLIDGAVERALRADVPLEEQIHNALLKPLNLLIVTLAGYLALAATVFDIVPGWVVAAVGRVTETLVMAALFWVVIGVIGVVAYYLRRMQGRYAGLNDRIVGFGAQVARLFVIVIAFVAIADVWGYDLSVVVTSFGLGTVAVSLAAQDTIANFIGYFAIMSDRIFDVGNFVVASEFSGVVEKIGYRSTRIRQPDQSLVMVPNKTVAAATITNWSHLDKRQLNMTLPVLRSTPADRVLAVVEAIRSMLSSTEHTVPGSVIVQFVGFGENSLDIMVIALFELADWAAFQAAKQSVNLEIVRILQRHGVRLAVPQAVVLSGDTMNTPAAAAAQPLQAEARAANEPGHE